MTEDQKKKCNAIIHGHAAAAAGGNAVPIPGLGYATDLITMTTMAMSLAAVFGGGIKENVAQNLAIAALKKEVLKSPIKTAAKELSKLVPVLGQVVAPTVSLAMLEAAGWVMAADLEKKSNEKNG